MLQDHQAPTLARVITGAGTDSAEYTTDTRPNITSRTESVSAQALYFAPSACAMDTSHSGVVLLLGAPGVGKSALGKLLQRTHAATVDAFVNVGDQLRATGKVEQHLRNPTTASKQELSHLASDILDDAFRAFKARMNLHM